MQVFIEGQHTYTRAEFHTPYICRPNVHAIYLITTRQPRTGEPVPDKESICQGAPGTLFPRAKPLWLNYHNLDRTTGSLSTAIPYPRER